MPIKPGSWCTKCRKVHKAETCPHRKPFQRKRGSNQQSGRGGRAWQRTREFIFNRDRFLCQIHLKKGELVSVELHGGNHGVCDHIIPIAQGGGNDHHNLQTICQACDREKTLKESLQTQKTGGYQ
jgi:5-methylcytosine-specific restriction protein A